MIFDLINHAINANFDAIIKHLSPLTISNSYLYSGLIGFMSFKKMGKGASAGGYYIDSAGLKNNARGVDDYYTQSEGYEPAGYFFDPSSALDSANIYDNQLVNTEAFQRLLAGRDPSTGDALVQEVDEKHVAGFDCTFSVPKNISALWAVAEGDQKEALERLMAEANKTALKFLSDKAGFTRRGSGGGKHEHVDLIAATWPHSSSREADPQKHFHNTVINVAKRADGTWGTIESKHLMQWQTSAGAVFRAALAEGLQKEFKGIQISNNEKTKSFDIEGIPVDLLKFWSKRTNEINDLAKESGATSKKQIDVIKMESRKDKSFGEGVQELQERWEAEAEALGFTQESIEAILLKEQQETMNPEEFKELFEKRMNAIPGELIEMDSIFTEQQLFRRVAELSAGVQGLDGIQATVDRLLKKTEINKLEEEKEVINNLQEIKNDRSIRSGNGNGIGAGILNGRDVGNGRSGPRLSTRVGRGRNIGINSNNNGSRRLTGRVLAASNYEPSAAAIEAVRARGGLSNSLRSLSESGLARNRPSKSTSLLRNNAQSNRRTINHLRRNVSKKPTIREEVIAEQVAPESIVIEIGVDREGRKVFTTLDQIKVEQDLKKRSGEMAEDGKHSMNTKIIEDAIAKRKTMSEEQADAVRHAFSPGSLKVIEGAAGAGKSFSLDAVREAFESQGYKLQGIALSWQAAKVLEESANIESRAITGFLADIENGKVKLEAKTVLVCDENGLVGSVYGQKILKHAQEAGAKVIITGDEEQLNPVQAGPAMKIMKSTAGSVKISEIRRQKELWAREMVFNFSKGNSNDALNALDSRGKVHLIDNKKETIARVANDFYDYLKSNKDKTALALGGSNEDTKNLNLAIRELKRADGLIGATDTTIKTEFGELPFAPGDKVMFRKNDKKMDVINRATGTLLSIDNYKDGHQLHIRLDDGRKLTVDSRKYKGEDGFLPIHHGDAMTVYSSQGMTVDQTFVMHSGSMDRRLAYVGYSRHREDTQVYVDKTAAINKMQSNLAADEYEGFKPTDIDIKEAIAKQYHSQTQKISTLDYISDVKAQEIIQTHAPVVFNHPELEEIINASVDWDSIVVPIEESNKTFETSKANEIGLIDELVNDHVIIVESMQDYAAIRKVHKLNPPTIIVAGDFDAVNLPAAFGPDERKALSKASIIEVAGRNGLDESANNRFIAAVDDRVNKALSYAPQLKKDEIKVIWPKAGDERLHETLVRKQSEDKL